jgi:hypothetical protein
MSHNHTTDQQIPSGIELPAPTAWPFTLAAGIALILGALVTNVALTYLGVVVFAAAAWGWFREVLPHERHEAVPVVPAPEIATARRRVARIQMDETHRAQLPLETYPVSSGVLGGVFGGIAMIIPAELYGLISFHSLWYPVNLLGGMGVIGNVHPTTAELCRFYPATFGIALVIHVATSLLVGLLYGSLLPVWPRHPILLGGIVAPALWTGLLYGTLNIINPFFSQRISWPWFALSQLCFGLVAGWTVSRRARIKRLAQVPLAARLGLQAPGLRTPREGGEGRQ